MTTYKLVANSNNVQRGDGVFIPPDPDNVDYQAYQSWCLAGNVATPADVIVPTASQQFNLYNAYTLYLLVALASALLAKGTITAADFDPITRSVYTKAKALLAAALPQLPPVP